VNAVDPTGEIPVFVVAGLKVAALAGGFFAGYVGRWSFLTAARADEIGSFVAPPWAGEPENNALTHCIWQCRLARSTSPGSAAVAGALYEVLGDAMQYWDGRLGDGSTTNDALYDLRNNECGRRLATSSQGGCEAACGDEIGGALHRGDAPFYLRWSASTPQVRE